MMSLQYCIKALLISMLIAATACQKDIELDLPPQDPKIVLHGLLIEDSVLRVQLTQSRFVLSTGPLNLVEDANLELFEDDRQSGNWHYLGGGVYEAQGFRPVSGKTYRITAKAPGKEAISAEAQVPASMRGVSVVDEQVGGSDYEKDVRLKFRIEDPGQTDDYYMVNLYQKLVYTDPMGQEFHTYASISIDTEAVNVINTCEEYWGGGSCQLLFSDKVFQGKSQEISINYRHYKQQDQFQDVQLVVSRVSEAYYKHKISLYQQQLTDDNPFAEPTPLYMNVEGGYGILGAAAPVWIKVP